MNRLRLLLFICLTLPIWCFGQRPELVIPEGHYLYIQAVALSPDGQMVLTGDIGGTAKLWTANGKEVQTFTHEPSVAKVAFTPDGRYLITAATDGTVKRWSLDGKVQSTFEPRSDAEEAATVTFSVDGKLILISDWNGGISLYHNDGTQLWSSAQDQEAIISIVFAPDQKTFVTGDNLGDIKLWDLNGTVLTAFTKQNSGVGALAFTPDGQTILSGHQDGSIKRWSRNGNEQGAFTGNETDITSMAVSPDGRYVLTGTYHGYGKLWSIEGTAIRDIESAGFSVAFASDSQSMLAGAGEGDNTASLWGIDGSKIEVFTSQVIFLDVVTFGPDGQTLWLNDGLGLDIIGRNLRVKDLPPAADREDFTNQFLSPDGQTVLRPKEDNDNYRIELEDRSGKILQTYTGHRKNSVYQAAFTPDGNFFATSILEGREVKFWQTKSGEELATLMVMDSVNWVVLSPSGLFDASPGAMQFMHYVVFYDNTFEIIDLEQLKARYYEPGLLQKLLGYSDERTRSVEGLDQVALYPEVMASIEADQLNLRLKERSGGIGPLSIFSNGKEIVKDANPQRKTSLTYDLKQVQQYLFRHPDSTNVISLRVYNEAGWLKSSAINLVYQPTSWARGSDSSGNSNSWTGKLDPKMFVVSLGTSDYTGTQLDLQYATQDATAMALALQSVGSNLFSGDEGIEVHCLTTASSDSTGLEGTPVQWQYASKENLQSVLTDIKQKAKAEDILLVYLSGHGVTHGGAEQSQFYYLTSSIASEDMIGDADVRNKYTISSGELTEWINDIAALKQVLVVDACNSGKVVENLTSGTRNLNSSQIRALDRMKDRTGMFILSGSAADKVSYEASEYGQGLLTYSLLQGMLGVATRKTADGDYVDVMKLFQYARDEVPRLAATINGIQTPMLGFPKTGASFDIGIFDQNTKISIGSKKPVIIRPNFLNQATLKDDLGLVKLLEAEFREETEKGKDADLIYVDVTDYPGAYSLSGLYSKDGDNIILTIKLFENGQNPKDLEIPATDDPGRLVKLILREVKRAIR